VTNQGHYLKSENMDCNGEVKVKGKVKVRIRLTPRNIYWTYFMDIFTHCINQEMEVKTNDYALAL
jgi:hypothetical protein